MGKMTQSLHIFQRIESCRLCKDQFARTPTAHVPRPVLQGQTSARILIAGQAPGLRVHVSGCPFTDASGDRLRHWMGLSEKIFYDSEQIAIIPMAFCFPGYSKSKADLPPPKICARTWRQEVLEAFDKIELTILVGRYAQQWHLGTTKAVSDVVRQYTAWGPHILPLPHPSWRNTHWLTTNPWFDQDVVPYLRRRVQEILSDRSNHT